MVHFHYVTHIHVTMYKPTLKVRFSLSVFVSHRFSDSEKTDLQ